VGLYLSVARNSLCYASTTVYRPSCTRSGAEQHDDWSVEQVSDSIPQPVKTGSKCEWWRGVLQAGEADVLYIDRCLGGSGGQWWGLPEQATRPGRLS
jgi:hypothetical protein